MLRRSGKLPKTASTHPPAAERPAIRASFDFPSKFCEVLGSKMHYIEGGTGDPILFLHGNPTSSYIWRNIMPYVQPMGRCIAPDLIGMGKSSKPDIEYFFQDHANYIDAFIQNMGLNNITLVLHDWGSALGFHYWARYPGKIKGLAFMEAITKTFRWKDFNLFDQLIFRRLRDPGRGRRMITEENFFIEKVLPMMTVRKLTAEEKDHYRVPYPTTESRRLLWVWVSQIPIEGEPADVHDIISAYGAHLAASDIPKLLLWAKPGAIIKEKEVRRLTKSWKALETVYVGKGKHYLQEDQPEAIGRALARWCATLIR